ncbi:MAG: sigma-54 dependent transcriptional regulator [Myxococcota bacterium]
MAAERPLVLLADDDAAFRRVYAALLEDAGWRVVEAGDRSAVLRALEEGADRFYAVILDLMLPPDGTREGGLTQLAEVVSLAPRAKIIVASGAGDVPTMLAATKHGAYDFLTKPVDPDVLLIVVARAIERARLLRELEDLRARVGGPSAGDELVGDSAVFLAARSLAERVAKSDLPVLITGDNGTGKELLAKAIHAHSPRAARRFVAVNCGAIPETLIESTFFGHHKGAFTGAVRDEPGLFREADGGTLFLDEIGDMPLLLQVKVLRALENQEILPVGASKSERVDVRIVSATNRDLLQRIAAQAFREDLYWRIKGAEVRLPSLAERKDDLPLLARHFLNRAAHLSADGRPKQLDETALEAMREHPWPGNLRELRHEMQRATVLAADRRTIVAEDLSFGGRDPRPSTPLPEGESLPAKVEALERREISAALAKTGQNRSKAAVVLGLSRQGLLNKMDRYGLG